MRLGSLCCGVLIVTSALSFLSIPVADNDLWGHLFFGRAILAGEIPATNAYSYTAPDHPWINHELLAECAFAWVFDTTGAAGLIVFKLAVGLATLVILARVCRRRAADPLARSIALVLAASLMSYGFLFRPQIFTFLALAIVWERLHAYAAGVERRWIWTLPPLFAVWTNTHGGVLAGLAVLGAFTLSFGALDGTREDRKRLTLVTVSSAMALVVNPYGLELARFLLVDVLRERPITEWKPIPLFDLSNLQFKLALAAAVIGAAVSPRRHGWELTVVALGAAAAFRHERHLPLFAILAAPHLAATFANAARAVRRWGGIAELSGPAHAVLAAALLLIAGTQARFAYSIHRDLGLGILVPPDQFPIEAVRFLRDNRLEGNLAVPFGWGEYALWHLFPRCRVSFDGRYTTAYPDDVIEDAWRYMDGGPGWDVTLRNASLALVDRRHWTLLRLAERPDWKVVHADEVALVFARDGAGTSLTRASLSADGVPLFP